MKPPRASNNNSLTLGYSPNSITLGRVNRATKIFIGFSVGILAVLLAIYLADLALNRGHVPRGTTVGGVAIGGLTPQEAEAELKAQLGDAPSRPITVTSGPERAEVVPQRAGLGIDYLATVEAAGLQSASPIERLSGLIREHEVAVVPSVDDAKLAPEITRLQKELHRDPIDAAITLEGGTARERTPEDGQDVPADALRTQLTAHWLNPDGVTVEPQPIAPRIGAPALKEAMDGPVHRALSGPLTVNGREDVTAVIPKERIGEILHFDEVLKPVVDHKAAGAILGEQLHESEVEAKNARVLTSGSIEPSVDGINVDWDATFKGFDDRLLHDADRTWDATYKDVPAAFTTADAEQATFNDTVGSFTTGGFSGASGENIRIVANTVNGAIVNPGETFSLNGYTGPRGTAQGYVESGIIINGRGGTAVGGGISQFATTLYNAAYFAGMTDVASTPHSYYISRYPAGREATVYEGAIDLAFRNDSNHPVKIVTNYGGGNITVSLMGVKTVNVQSINGGRWAYTQPQPRTVTGPDCAPSGGAPGFTTSDTRVITDLAGNELSRETTTTVYDPQPIVRCG